MTGFVFEKIQRRYNFQGRKADPLIFRGRWIRLFWHQNGALLWRADPSFKNSVTGSDSIAKCSNILQEIRVIMLSVIVLDVIMLSVEAPIFAPFSLTGKKQ